MMCLLLFRQMTEKRLFDLRAQFIPREDSPLCDTDFVGAQVHLGNTPDIEEVFNKGYRFEWL
jgi:hypothetical protein